MNKQKVKIFKRKLRHQRVRSVVQGTRERPRLSVYRSLKQVFLQLIDDEDKKTLLSISSKKMVKTAENPYKGKMALAYVAGLNLAKKALEKGIQNVCFDRGGFAYHGRIKAAAEGARIGGLKF